mgnify:CR=1 FL=1
MKPLRLFSTLALSAVIALCAATAWKLRTAENAASANRAWGNVETRQTSLAFEASGRIAALHKEEGESVGQLDDEALRISRRQAAAELKRLQAQAALAHEGTREEDIDAARANEAAARAQLEYASATLKRQQDLVPVGAASRQMLDDARRAEHAARESLTAAAAQRAAVEKGPRAQEIAAADAAAEAAAASLAALDYQIHRGAVLTAPSAGIIRARLAEPGDMASPSRTIYQLSVADPKWIRAYLTERQLGLVKEGTLATVFTDTVGPVDGTVAFVSDTAEFTPKTVQTEDLRASLVYEVRITVRDPENRLRLGQPVTVEFAQPRSSPHD